jgi:hypothetical protein
LHLKRDILFSKFAFSKWGNSCAAYAADRLNAYSRVWFQSLFQIFVAHKKSIAPAQMLARSSSAQELAIMVRAFE